jgi:hypothetical protein
MTSTTTRSYVRAETDPAVGHREYRDQGSTRLPAAIALVTGVIAFFQLVAPFNLAETGLPRLLTTNRLILYAAGFSIVWMLFDRRIYLLKAVHGKWLLCLMVVGYLLSQAQAFDPDTSWTYVGVSVSLIVLYGVILVWLVSMRRIEMLVRGLIYMGAFLFLITRLGLITLDQVLPHTFTADAFARNVNAETVSTGVLALSDRASLLWFDANNAGYIAAELAVLTCFLILGNGVSTMLRVLHWVLLISFVVMLTLTVSRGATAAFMVASIPLSMALVRPKYRFLLPALLAVTIAAGAFIAPLASAGLALEQRFELLFGFLGLSSSGYTALESLRAETQQLAWMEFLVRPVLGWGGMTLGVSHGSGNHLFYLNYMGNWGLVGFTLLAAFMASVGYRLIRASVRLRQGNDQIYRRSLVFVALLVVLAMQGFTGNLVYDAWIGVALAMAFCRLVERPPILSALSGMPLGRSLNQPRW